MAFLPLQGKGVTDVDNPFCKRCHDRSDYFD